MTAYYVRSGASGSANGTSWANAYTTMAAALSGKAAGDIFYVSEDHSESFSTTSITFPGTLTSPNCVYCVDHTGSVPPTSADLRNTALLTATGSGFTIGGSVYWTGVKVTVSTNFLQLCNAAGQVQTYKNCALKAGNNIFAGNGNQSCTVNLADSTVEWSAAAKSLIAGCILNVAGGAIAATGSVPTTLMTWGGFASSVALNGVDLSAISSSLFATSSTHIADVKIQACKLNSSVSITSTPTYPSSPLVDALNCDSGATNYRNERYRYEGTLTTETTIVRTGGASDGTTSVSHKIVTTANSKWTQPFESFPIAIWNDTVGSPVTATIYGIWGGGAVPNNDDIWIEAEYLGSSGSPQASFATGGKADGLASNAALSSDASSWGGSTTAFKMAVTFTPQQKGLIYVTVKAAKASSTFYVDPKIELS